MEKDWVKIKIFRLSIRSTNTLTKGVTSKIGICDMKVTIANRKIEPVNR